MIYQSIIFMDCSLIDTRTMYMYHRFSTTPSNINLHRKLLLIGTKRQKFLVSEVSHYTVHIHTPI